MKPARRRSPKTLNELQPVIIVWRDAALDSDHEASLDQPPELNTFGGMATCRDIGWLISKNRKEVKLAVGQILDNNSVRHANTIPAGWIREIIYLNNPFSEEIPQNAPSSDSL